MTVAPEKYQYPPESFIMIKYVFQVVTMSEFGRLSGSICKTERVVYLKISPHDLSFVSNHFFSSF